VTKEDNKKGHRMGSTLEARRFDDYSYINSPAFKEYLDNYIKFIHEHKEALDVYVTVDIINNAEETWKIQKFLESNGITPIPVWHYGSDTKWLEKYIDEYDYIGIGGMVPLRESQLLPGLDNVWDRFLTNRLGKPVVKVHGLAATAINLMFRYPWWSVDSTSWIVYSMYGIILIPKFDRFGERDYAKTPVKVAISEKSKAQFDDSKTFYDHLSSTVKHHVDRYIEETARQMIHEFVYAEDPEGYEPDFNRIIDVLKKSHPARETFNAMYYTALERMKRTSPFKKLLRRQFLFEM
jgi:hypothetical protein